MKAVIVEIKDGIAAVLSDDGCIKKLKNNNYAVGQVIQYSEPKLRYTKKFAVFAASAAALAIFSVGTWAYASPYSYVSLDVNPSIEYTLNRFDRVLQVKAVNDDGEEILKDIDLNGLKHNKIQDALTKTVEQISDAGYFDGETLGGIMIATYGKDPAKTEEMAQDLEQTVENEVAQNGDTVEVEAVSVGSDRVEQAKELGVTPGKLNLVEKLKAAASDPDSVDLEEWLSKPVKDIMKATKDFDKAKTEETSGPETPADEQQNASLQTDKNEENPTAAEDKAQKDQDKEDQKDQKASDKADQKDQKASDKTDKKDQKTSDKAGKKDQKASDKTGQGDQKSPAVKDQNNQNNSGKTGQSNNNNQNTSVQKENKSSESTGDVNNNSDDKNNKSDDKSDKSSKESKNQPADNDQTVLDASAQNGAGNKDSSGNSILNGQDNTYDQQKESDQKKIDSENPSNSNTGKSDDNTALNNGKASENPGNSSNAEDKSAGNASANASDNSGNSNKGGNHQ